MNGPAGERVRLAYFSDVLCVWAYVSQVRLDELRRTFGDRIELRCHYLPIFGCTERRVGEKWRERGGYEGYGAHVLEVCREFPHVQVHPQVWRSVRPCTSALAHAVLKAAELLARAGMLPAEPQERLGGRTVCEAFAWDVRCAFFRDDRDVSSLRCLFDIAEAAGIAAEALAERLEDGSAMAEVCRDAELAEAYRIEGSPTFLLNEGRQKLYGNVGYRILEANVREVLERPHDRASWC